MQIEHASPSRDYFPALTGLRGVAAGWVVLFHWWLLAGAPRVAAFGIDVSAVFSCGFLGVDLFFVLSGFLLGLPFLQWARGARAFPDLARFWKRRCLRVLPAYYAQLGILILAGWLIGGAWPVDLRKLLAYLSMQFVFFDGIAPLLNGVWWSLPVEWNFYIVLPLLGLMFARARWWLVAGGVLVAVVAFRLFCYQLLLEDRAIGPVAYPMILQLPGRLDEFVFGMVAAWFHLRRGTPTPRRDGCALALGVAGLLGLLMVLDGRGDIFATAAAPLIFGYATFAGVLLALIVYAAASPLRLARVLFGGRVLAFLGTISYSLYLWHAVVFQVAYASGFAPWTYGAGITGRVLLAVLPTAVSLAIAWLSYRLTEHPFLVTAPASHQGRFAERIAAGGRAPG